MPSSFFPTSPITKATFLKNVWPLLALFLIGTSLHFIFWTGSAFPQSIELAKALWHSSEGIRHTLQGEGSLQDLLEALALTRSLIGFRQFIFFSPSIFLYSLFGFNDQVTGLYSLFSILLIAAWLYLLGKENGNKTTGLLAAWLWLAAPVVIATSSTLFSFQPILALLLGSLYTFHLWQKTKKPSNIFTSQILLLVVFLGDPLWGIMSLLLLLGSFAFSVWTPERVWILIGTIGLVVLVIFPAQTFFGVLGWYRQLINIPGIWLLFSLLAIVLLHGFRGSKLSPFQNLNLYWLILGIMVNGLCKSPLEACNSANDLGLPIHTIFVLIPIVLLSAQQLSQELNSDAGQTKIIWVAFATGFLSLVIFFIPLEISPSYENGYYLDPRVILLLSDLVLAFVFLGAMAYIYFSGQGTKRRTQKLAIIFIGLISFASLQPNWEWSKQHTISTIAIQKALLDYQRIGKDLPLTFANETLAARTNYLSGFSLQEGTSLAEEEISFQVVNSAELFSVLDTFVITQSTENASRPPTNWWLVSEYDLIDGSQLQLYRSLSDNTAQKLRTQAVELIGQEPSVKHYQNLYGALINNNAHCEGYQAWMDMMKVGETSGYIQTITPGKCFCPIENDESIDLRTTTETIYPGAYISVDNIETSADSFSRISQVYVFYQDPRTFEIPFTLEPGQFYSYGVDIRSDQPVIGLFIKVGKTEWYLPERSYPDEWVSVEALLSTHGWDSYQEVILSPVLFDPTATVDIKSYQLTRIGICADQQ